MILDDIHRAILTREKLPSFLNISHETYEELLKDERTLNQPYFGNEAKPQLSIMGVLTKVNQNLDKPFELIV
ncbi:hypothetical protein [Acinetobacter bereziniae]|uniref:hypothetical protein n=1 Tax=Acinetobacter bereziniae TaxID=106648 RepID=UPI00125F57B4|nr:hypothetical protein [Acinetobacter bereziniae]